MNDDVSDALVLDDLVPERTWVDAQPTVLAVIVVRNGERWLLRLLDSLARQKFAPTTVLAVDLGSTDASAQILARHGSAPLVRSAPADTGFGDAVRVGLDASPPAQWLWLLHDDCAPEPGALGHLLDEAMSSPQIAVVGPKLREWPSLRRLLEVGVTIMGTGRRETGLERGEPDQGQHDRPRDVLGVSTAGMLVRRETWDALDGLDPALPLFCDDVDFGWRVARHGQRTRVCPRAVLFHAEASVHGSRTGSSPGSTRREQRRAALYTLLVNASPAGFVWQWFRLLVGSLLRVIGLLLAKAPGEAGDEALAALHVYCRPLALLAARRRRSATAEVSARAVRHLLPATSLPYRHGLDVVAEVALAVVRPTPEISGRRAATPTGPVSEEPEDLSTDVPFLLRRPWLASMIALVALSLVSARGLIGSGSLHGGALLASPSSASSWWRLFFQGSHLVGVGSDAPGPPYAVVLAVPASLLGHHGGLVVDVVLLGSVPLAALTAHRLSRRLFASPWVQAWWSLTYAFLVVCGGAVAQGRLGTVVALVAAPAIVNAGLTLAGAPRPRAGFRLGLWLALATAFAPISYLLGVVPLMVAAIVLRRRRMAGPVVIAAVLPWLLLGSWMWTRALDPASWWWEAGNADAGVGALDPSVWQLVLGRTTTIGAAPALIGIGLLAGGVLALLRRDRSSAILTAWGIGLLGLALAVLGAGTYLEVGADQVPAWVGLPLTCWLAALAAAAGLAADGARDHLATRTFSGLQPVAVLVGFVALLAPLAAGVWWVARTVEDPLERGPSTDVPAYLVARAEAGQSTLVLRGDRADAISYSLYQGDGDRLGDETVMPGLDASRPLTRAVSGLLSNPTPAVLADLAGFGVRAVYLAAPADNDLADVLDASSGLAASGSPTGSRAWTFSSDVQRRPVPHADSRPWIASDQVVVLALALVAAAPGRSRREDR